MKTLLGILILGILMSQQVLYDFNNDANLDKWRIVDDVVMGGRSNGTLSLSEEGHGLFEGTISLENNGGFSSVRYDFSGTEVQDNTLVRIRLKGDGKRYQFRVKHDRRARYSYERYFHTSGEWQEVDIPLNEMIPTFRGSRLNYPDFNRGRIEEIAFLFGNKKPESFRLLIDKISLVTE